MMIGTAGLVVASKMSDATPPSEVVALLRRIVYNTDILVRNNRHPEADGGGGSFSRHRQPRSRRGQSGSTGATGDDHARRAAGAASAAAARSSLGATGTVQGRGLVACGVEGISEHAVMAANAALQAICQLPVLTEGLRAYRDRPSADAPSEDSRGTLSETEAERLFCNLLAALNVQVRRRSRSQEADEIARRDCGAIMSISDCLAVFSPPAALLVRLVVVTSCARVLYY